MNEIPDADGESITPFTLAKLEELALEAKAHDKTLVIVTYTLPKDWTIGKEEDCAPVLTNRNGIPPGRENIIIRIPSPDDLDLTSADKASSLQKYLRMTNKVEIVSAASNLIYLQAAALVR